MQPVYATIILALSVLFLSLPTLAGPGRTTYQAKIIKPDGLPLEASNVNFKFTILDPAGTCILYSETFSSVNMSSTSGLISFSLGSGVKTYPASATTFEQVFSNITPSLSCDTGGPVNYSPAVADIRKIVMQFHDGSGWQTLPAMSINAVPYAMYANEAQTLNGLASGDFVQLSTVPTCTASEALRYTGAGFTCVATGGSGSVTSGAVITALGYTPADGASVTTLTSNFSSVSSTVFSVSSTVTSLQNSVAASFAAITSSQWTTSGTNIFYNAGNVGIGTSSPGVRAHVVGDNASWASLRTDSTTNSWAGIDIFTSGGPRAGIYFDSGTTKFGSSGMQIQNMTISPMRFLLGSTEYFRLNSDGNVGIGTATPVAKLSVSGGIRISMESASCAVSYAGTIRYNAGTVEYCNGTIWSAFGGSVTSSSVISALGYTPANSATVVGRLTGVENLSFATGAGVSLTAGGDYNILMGTNAGSSLTTGDENIVVGREAGKSNTTGFANLFIGSYAGTNNTGDENTFVGAYSGGGSAGGSGSGYSNAIFGAYAGAYLTSGYQNTLIGYRSGQKITTGFRNYFGGYESGQDTTEGYYNVFIGYSAGLKNTTANNSVALGASALTWFVPPAYSAAYNTAIGAEALIGVAAQSTGVRNTALGGKSGDSITTGSDNILIGYNADVPTPTTSNFINIGNTIYGNSSTGKVGINTTSPQEKLHVSGTMLVTGDWGSGPTLTVSGAGTRMFFYPRKAAFRGGYAYDDEWNEGNLGEGSFAYGDSVVASGSYSVAMGRNSRATAPYATAFGQGDASGDYSTAFDSSTASGLYSFAFGSSSANADRAIAMGGSSSANGESSVAIGRVVLSNAYRNVAVGSYNIGSGSGTAWIATDPIFEIGNSQNGLPRTNAMTVLKNGNVGVTVSAPTARLHLASGTASLAPLKFTSGTLLSSPQSGTMEYDGSNFYLTDSTNTRRTIATGSSAGTIDNASNINSSGNITLAPTGSVVVSSTTASTNSSTGALVVKGGLGVAGNIYTSGTIITSSNIQGASVTATNGMISPYIAGSIGSGGSLTLDSTTHATKGNIYLAPNGGNVGIGTTTPTTTFVVSGVATFIKNASGGSFDSTIISKAPNGQLQFGSHGSVNKIVPANLAGSAAQTLYLEGPVADSIPQIYMRTEDLTVTGTNPVVNVGTSRVHSNGSSYLMGGNVGVGTTAPSRTLEVSGSTQLKGYLFVGNAPSSWSGNPIVGNGNASRGSLTLLHSTVSQSQTSNGLDLSLVFSNAELNLRENGYMRLMTNNSERMRIDATGNVGIGTTSPRATLDISGTVLMKPAVVDTTSPIDFSTGNLQYTTGNCGAFALHNMKDGGSYTFAVKGTTSTTCSFTAYSDAGATALTLHMPTDHGATTASKHTLYTFLVMGTDLYVTWMPGM